MRPPHLPGPSALEPDPSGSDGRPGAGGPAGSKGAPEPLCPDPRLRGLPMGPGDRRGRALGPDGGGVGRAGPGTAEPGGLPGPEPAVPPGLAVGAGPPRAKAPAPGPGPGNAATPPAPGAGLLRAVVWGWLLFLAAAWLAPERGLGGSAAGPGEFPELLARRLAAEDLGPAPGPLERLRRDPGAALCAREWRALPGIGHARAAEIELARRAAGGRIDWRALESATGLGPATIARLAEALRGLEGLGERPARSHERGAGPAAPRWQRLSWPR